MNLWQDDGKWQFFKDLALPVTIFIIIGYPLVQRIDISHNLRQISIENGELRHELRQLRAQETLLKNEVAKLSEPVSLATKASVVHHMSQPAPEQYLKEKVP